MLPDKNEQIKSFIRNQVTKGEERLLALTRNEKGETLPTRSAFLSLNKRLRQYIASRNNPNWIAVPGLRGTGKTTLLAQVYTSLKWKRGYKLYVSLDEAKTLGFSLKEILAVYQELLGKTFKDLDISVFLFLDEIQYEEDWGTVLKVITDKPSKVFVMCTGSSALSLQTNADVARRIVYEKLYPLSFMEYILIKFRKKPITGLGENIRKVLFESATSEDVFSGLKSLESKVDFYWKSIDLKEMDTYLKYGTLPFALQLPEEALIYTQINQTLNNILTKDVPDLRTFDKKTIDRLSQVLYLTASTDILSMNKMAQFLKIDFKILTSVFDTFEKTELLIRVYPHGYHFGQVKKPSKYLFSAPAYRSMYFNLVGSVEQYAHYKGKLLEDAVGMYLYRILLAKSDTALTYDSSQGGADFIIDTRIGVDGRIAIEVGTGEKECDQAITTLNKIGGRYGLIISESNLILHEQHKCVLVPLKYFLLI